MDNFLLSIAGLSSENLTTEVLRYILENDAYKIYQKVFFNYLFDDDKNLDSSGYSFTITTQGHYKDGIPDLLIENDNYAIIIENKFYAPYSGGNQISNYINILNKEFRHIENRTVYLLTIRARLEYYKKLVQEDVGKLSEKEKDGVDVKFIIWEELLRRFESGDFIISHLTEYIKKKFLYEIKFKKEELELLSNENVPAALDKLYTSISKLRDLIDGDEQFKVGRIGQSYNYYGFMIESKYYKVWFGSALTLWREKINGTLTPLHMQYRMIWVKDLLVTEQMLKEVGFTYNNLEEWVRPFKADLINEPEKLKLEILCVLENLDKMLICNG